LLFSKAPSTVAAAHVGDPTMKDPPPTYATQVNKATLASYNIAIGKTPENPAQPSSAIENGTAPPRTDQPAPAPKLENVPDGSGTGVGAEIVQPSSNAGGAPDATPAPAGNPAPLGTSPAPAAGSGTPATAVPDSGGLKPVGPAADAAALPPVDKPSDAPTQVNDVKQAPATVTTGTTSAEKSKYDASKESSSKHKKKKGLDKLNPF
jgi:outer membrane protein assembly factor BamD